MSGTPSRVPRKVQFYLAAAFVLAVLGAYFLAARFPDLREDTQRQVAMLLGSAGIVGGTLWIAFFARARQDHPQATSIILGPLGFTQLFAGLTLLLWVARLRWLAFVSVCLSIVCFVASSVTKRRSRRP